MGRENGKITITTELSRHNSEQDEIDNAAQQRLLDRIRELIAEDEEFNRIVVWVTEW